MKLYRVYAIKAGTLGHCVTDNFTADGFSSRSSAERYAIGLASSGQAYAATIESYEDDDENDDEEES